MRTESAVRSSLCSWMGCNMSNRATGFHSTAPEGAQNILLLSMGFARLSHIQLITSMLIFYFFLHTSILSSGSDSYCPNRVIKYWCDFIVKIQFMTIKAGCGQQDLGPCPGACPSQVTTSSQDET